ncbi:rare lipoprotein A [Aeromonas sp. BIGb0405]|uniref:septal ring lytic transglycosylase RlpA family protein n=1 Tax=Aeromonas sp. BIGb0405 TaxID=2940592 RepID=UPI002167FD5E|nr:septal ring lytic transglycosylase RlpA family protein [Aeromonas sp. BIGb0405]MCS3454966.1 rare lipoprotein A [Aeromonas sp. BIGb0405]
MQHNQALLLSLTLLLAACSSQPEQPPAPPSPPVQVEKPPVIEFPQATGAIPRHEPLSASGNRDYWVGKQKYQVWRDIKDYSEEGSASWLDQGLDGNKTANGDIMDSSQFSAAHRNLPLPSYVRVTNLDNGKETIVRVNDRGPFTPSRLIDLSHAAAHQLGMVDNGTARVRLDLITDTPDQQIERVADIPMTDTLAAQAPEPLVAAKPPVAPPAKPAVKAQTPVASTAATPATGSDKRMQVLASGSQQRAQSLAESLGKQYGVPHQIEAAGHVFRVLLGPIPAAKQAELLQQLRSSGFEQAFLLP